MTRRQVIVCTVTFAALILIAALPVATPPGSDGVLNVEEHQTAAPIFVDTVVTQQFPAGGDTIHTVTLYLATFGRMNRGTLHVSVFAESKKAWQRLTTREIDEATLLDNSYNTIVFSPPLAVTRGNNVRIVLESDSPPSDAVAWWVNPLAQPSGYRLTKNEIAAPGAAVFQVHYQRAVRPLILSLGAIWRDVTPFLAAPWEAMLLIAFLGAMAGGALIFRHLPDDHAETPSESGIRSG